MRNSLSEQLLKAGLVTEEQVKKAQEKPQPKPQPPKKKAAKGKKRPAKQAKPQAPQTPQTPELTTEEKAAIKAHKQKIREFLREHRLNKNQVDDEVKKALGKVEEPVKDEEKAEAKPEAPKETGPLADIKYHFHVAGRTHHLYVTRDQRLGLIAGQLSILLRNERYYLLTAEDTATLRELDPESLFFTASSDDQQAPDENDPYSDYQVPDDLHW